MFKYFLYRDIVSLEIFKSHGKPDAFMMLLSKISLFQLCSRQDILTPLSRLCALLNTSARVTGNCGLLFATLKGVKISSITNSLLINNVKNGAFFTYFYFITC